ncbi:hypothetical protein Tco_0236210 [Tanacetum coccineum]
MSGLYNVRLGFMHTLGNLNAGEGVAGEVNVGILAVRNADVDVGIWKVGTCEDVLGGLNKDEQNAIMDASMALFGEFLAAISDNVYSPKVCILKPVSYAGAAGASSAVQKKGRANFRPLESENVCDGVNLTIPIKIVEEKVRYEPKAHGKLPKNGAPMVSISTTNDPSKKLHAKKGGLHVHTSKPSVSTSNPYDVEVTLSMQSTIATTSTEKNISIEFKEEVEDGEMTSF